MSKNLSVANLSKINNLSDASSSRRHDNTAKAHFVWLFSFWMESSQATEKSHINLPLSFLLKLAPSQLHTWHPSPWQQNVESLWLHEKSEETQRVDFFVLSFLFLYGLSGVAVNKKVKHDAWRWTLQSSIIGTHLSAYKSSAISVLYGFVSIRLT